MGVAQPLNDLNLISLRRRLNLYIADTSSWRTLFKVLMVSAVERFHFIKTRETQLSFIGLLPPLCTHQLSTLICRTSFLAKRFSVSLFLNSNCWHRYMGLISITYSTFQEVLQPHLMYFRVIIVWTNIPADQPVPSMGFPGLHGIYKLTINQLNFWTPGPCENKHNDPMKLEFHVLRIEFSMV